jgi:diaminopimelate epimerase
MTVDYYYVDPTGNITLLCDTPVPKEQRREAALELMRLEPSAEQVGFTRGKTLNMAGGEFCGNATIGAAALYCEKNGLTNLDTEMTVSGTDSPVKVSVTGKDGVYRGSVTMPAAESAGNITVETESGKYDFPFVALPGIVHIISETALDKDEAERIVKYACEKLGCDAAGLMIADTAAKKLTPLVYVPGANTLVWESSCASGTCALGIYLSNKYGVEIKEKFTQPGGTLGVEVLPGGTPVLSGGAVIRYRKTAEIKLTPEV